MKPAALPETIETPKSRETKSKARIPDARSLSARARRIALALFALLALAVLLDVGMGESEVAAKLPPAVVLRVIARHIPLLAPHIAPPDFIADAIVWQQRLPRALGAALIGLLLAGAGVAFQGLLMNPLADPYSVGVSAGSALGSAIIGLLGWSALLNGFAQPLAAFATGLAAAATVYALARVGGRVSSQNFLLAGIVIGTFFWSLIPLMLSLAKSMDRQSAILAQLLGNLEGVNWRSLGLLLPFALVGGVSLFRSATELNLMAQGEESAAHLGVDVERFKKVALVSGSLATAATVSVAGIIAWVGLLVPHIARRLVGPDHRVLLPIAALLGGLTLVLSDWISRVFLHELEVGVITSLLGAPVFCLLLRRRITGTGN